ncbi:hypothetical protein VCHC47A1_1422, partial [Vibrio cholerae HC-47A1]
MDGGKK